MVIRLDFSSVSKEGLLGLASIQLNAFKYNIITTITKNTANAIRAIYIELCAVI